MVNEVVLKAAPFRSQVAIGRKSHFDTSSMCGRVPDTECSQSSHFAIEEIIDVVQILYPPEA